MSLALISPPNIPNLLWIRKHCTLSLLPVSNAFMFISLCPASSNAMIQQSQNEFDSSVEKAEDWMKTIQERLRINDNTKGPRSALEARLRDTEVKDPCSQKQYFYSCDYYIKAYSEILLQLPSWLRCTMEIPKQWH